MSLISNRGRFTQDDEKNNNGQNIVEQSALSSIGLNPKNMFDLENKDDDKKEKEDIKDKLSNVDVSKLKDFEPLPSHKEYNIKLNKANENKSNKEDSFLSSTPKRKLSIFTIISMFIVEAITIALIIFFGQVYRFLSLTQPVDFDREEVVKNELDPITIENMKGYKTVAIFGVDSRTGSVDKGNNSDVNIIANLNLETGEIQLVSVYRDLYLSITDDNLYGKLNSAYRKGGPEQAVKTINKNFDLHISNYFSFNWKAVADGIELLGGIDIEVTKSEYKYLNAFIHETCIATGIDAKNPAAHYIKSYGFQHLNGIQAVAYGRLRLMDSDFQRVERQKKIIGLCLEKAKLIDGKKLKLIVEAVLPQIGYAFDMNEVLSLIKLVTVARITESTGCPDVSSVRTVQMGDNGDCIVPLNLQKSVTLLHKILFNVDNYNPTGSVKNYSARITELRHKYEEENKNKTEEGETLEGEELIDESNVNSDGTKTTTKKRVATSSSAKPKTSETAPNDLPITDADSNVEEPESDATDNNNTTNTTNNNAVRVDAPVSNSTQNSSTGNNSAPVNNAPQSNNDYTVYDAPGVPATTANNNLVSPGPVQIAPGSNNTSGTGTVVTGPPTGDLNPGNASVNINEVVPIIGAPN